MGIERTYLKLTGFSGCSDGKEATCNAGNMGLTPGLGKIPWRRKWLTISFLAKRIPWTGVLAGYSPWDQKESDMTELLILSFTFTSNNKTQNPYVPNSS